MFDYIPESSRPRPPTPMRKPTAGTTTRRRRAAHRSCSRATRSRGPSTPRSRPAGASPHGGVFLDIAIPPSAPSTSSAGCPRCTTSSRSWPTSTSPTEAMEVGPTCHYVMGGIRVDADTAAPPVPGPVRGRRVSPAGMHGSNRLGGNSLSRPARVRPRAGGGAAEYARRSAEQRPTVDQPQVEAVAAARSRPFERGRGEEPLHPARRAPEDDADDLVGIIRTEAELERALKELRAAQAGGGGRRRRGTPPVQPRLAPGARPAQHAAPSRECIATAALAAEGEPGRSHPRRLSRRPIRSSGRSTTCCACAGGELQLSAEPLPQMPDDLKELFDPAPAASDGRPQKADA